MPLMYYAYNYLGMVLIFMNMLPFIGLLEKSKTVLTTKDHSLLDVRILLPYQLSAFVWWLLGYSKHDVYLMVPNLVGMLLICS
mmetsp:Transcript_24610/g.11777  ORF Transcript_24610/g.11777 Transcript_24610/m.11777 type:complete len:83 (+) Transcript_24610:155-403(+)